MNNEDNNLDMNKPMSKKEYYITKLEKYEELNKQTQKDIFLLCSLTILPIIFILLSSVNSIVNPDEYILSTIVGAGGSVGLIMTLSSVASSIAEKAGLESRINAIKEKLELLDLKSNTDYDEKYSQSEDYYEPILGFDEEEKGRNR